MADGFDDWPVVFPTNISYGSSGGPQFSTEIVILGSGHERRNQNWEQARERWNVAYGVHEQTHLDELVKFFYARRGMARGFRFKNHNDFDVPKQLTQPVNESSDGTATQFQIIKSYEAGGTTPPDYIRIIRKPIPGTIHVFVNDTEVFSGFVVDAETGIITFTTPQQVNQVKSACEFHVPVRFDTDHLPVNLETYKAKSADVPILEIRVDDA